MESKRPVTAQYTQPPYRLRPAGGSVQEPAIYRSLKRPRPLPDNRPRFSDGPEDGEEEKKQEPFSNEISNLLNQISKRESSTEIPTYPSKTTSAAKRIKLPQWLFAAPTEEALTRQHDRALKVGETGRVRFKGGPTKAECGNKDTWAGSYEMKTLRYNPPSWAGGPYRPYWVAVFNELEEIRRREFMETMSHMVFGRAPTADVRVPHISVSRHHFVIQFSGGGGVYVMDLGSTHGTFLMKLDLESSQRSYHKKQRIDPFSYTKISICDAISVGRFDIPIVLMAPSNPKLADDPDHLTCYDWVAGYCGRTTGCRFKHCAPRHPHYQPRAPPKHNQESTRQHFRNRFYNIVSSKTPSSEVEPSEVDS